MAQQDVTRRLAAIMSADVVGYSRLMGEDETGTLTAVKALRKELFALYGDGTFHRIDHARELHQCPVTHQFDDAAVVLDNLGCE